MRNNWIKKLFVSLLVLFLIPFANAEDEPVLGTGSSSVGKDTVDEEVNYDTIMDSIEVAEEERQTTGQIQEIDLTARTVIVSGFLYHLGPATDPYPLIVKVLGSEYGALELLKVGDHVQVLYIQAGLHRIGNDLIQIEESEEH